MFCTVPGSLAGYHGTHHMEGNVNRPHRGKGGTDGTDDRERGFPETIG